MVYGGRARPYRDVGVEKKVRFTSAGLVSECEEGEIDEKGAGCEGPALVEYEMEGVVEEGGRDGGRSRLGEWREF